MCKTNANKMDIKKIIERICKGIEFLMLSDEQKQEQRKHVSAVVTNDYAEMLPAKFASKYIEWIPTDLSAKLMNVHASAVRTQIESRAKEQQKLLAQANKPVRVAKVQEKVVETPVEEKVPEPAPEAETTPAAPAADSSSDPQA